MLALAKIALRNLVEHKGKTLIVGIIVALGVMILVVGNSILDAASRNLKRSLVESFTGQVIITGKSNGNVSLFGVASSGTSEGTPTLPDFEKITFYLAGNASVKSFTPQITGAEQLNKVGEDMAGGGPFVYLFGIDTATFGSMFDNVTMVSGAFLVPGEEGILLSTSQVQEFQKDLGTDLRVGDKILIQNFGSAIREVTLRGTFTFKERNSATDLISYVDPQTLRALLGMTSGTEASLHLDAEETALLSAGESTLFGGGRDMVRVASPAGSLPARRAAKSDGARVSAVQEPDGAAGPWTFILVNLKNPDDATSFIAQTNQWLARQEIGGQAAGWEAASGPFAELPSLLRIVFALAIFIIAIVAVIIIMNTLIVSINERTAEIGTMRALGAQKGFVWRMLFLETLTISIVFGIAGTLIGSLIVGLLNCTGIHASSTVMMTIAGSSALRPTVKASTLGGSILLVIVIAIVAQFYPVRTALRIQPVTAIQSRSE